MMKFIEQLEKAKLLGIDIFDLTIADELKCTLDFNYTEDEFEKLCQFTKDCIEQSAATDYLPIAGVDEGAIANVFNELVADEDYSISDILELSYCDILEKATYYM